MSHSLTHSLTHSLSTHSAIARLRGAFCKALSLFPILALTAILCLAHCSSDDNGGGSGSGGPTPDNTAPIFMWYTADLHNGNFGGVSGADTFCGEQAADASLPNTDRRSYTHRAILGSASRDPETAFNIPNVDMPTRKLQRPNGMQIAGLYTDYFSIGDLLRAVDDGTSLHWSGITLTGVASSETIYTCDDWSSSTQTAIIGSNVTEWRECLRCT